MLHRIEVDVINMPRQVRFIADEMLPESSLPQAAFTPFLARVRKVLRRKPRLIFALRGREKVGADNLSEREWQIAQQVAHGDDYKTVAQSTGIPPATVRTHVNNIFAKLGINDKARLAAELGRIQHSGL